MSCLQILLPDFTTGELLSLSGKTNSVLGPLFSLRDEYGILQMTSSLVEVLNDDGSQVCRLLLLQKLLRKHFCSARKLYLSKFQMDVCGLSSMDSYFARKSLVSW